MSHLSQRLSLAFQLCPLFWVFHLSCHAPATGRGLQLNQVLLCHETYLRRKFVSARTPTLNAKFAANVDSPNLAAETPYWVWYLSVADDFSQTYLWAVLPPMSRPRTTDAAKKSSMQSNRNDYSCSLTIFRHNDHRSRQEEVRRNCRQIIPGPAPLSLKNTRWNVAFGSLPPQPLFFVPPPCLTTHPSCSRPSNQSSLKNDLYQTVRLQPLQITIFLISDV